MKKNILKHFVIPMALALILGVLAFSPGVPVSAAGPGQESGIWLNSTRAQATECENDAACVEWCIWSGGEPVPTGTGCCQNGLIGEPEYYACTNFRHLN